MPVPLHRQRLKRRGYNQVSEILLPVQKALKIEVLAHSCMRVKYTRAQSELSAVSRKRNLSNAFEITEPIPYQHIALVDDVVTTGSTVKALSLLLKEAGVEQIDVWCICRA